ncbi:hypothetical protein IscW_ISCW006934, partial [Ixodes scapularis]
TTIIKGLLNIIIIKSLCKGNNDYEPIKYNNIYELVKRNYYQNRDNNHEKHTLIIKEISAILLLQTTFRRNRMRLELKLQSRETKFRRSEISFFIDLHLIFKSLSN